MARPTKEETELKIKSLDESIDKLIAASTSTKNLVTSAAVLQLANSLEYAESFSSNISPASIKNPKTPEYKRIKKRIDDHRKSFKTTKEIVSDATKKKINALEEQNESLLHELSELLDRSIMLAEEVESLKKSLDKVEKERDAYFERLNDVG